MKRVTSSPHERDALPADANCEMIAYGGGNAFRPEAVERDFTIASPKMNSSRLLSQNFKVGSIDIERVETP